MPDNEKAIVKKTFNSQVKKQALVKSALEAGIVAVGTVPIGAMGLAAGVTSPEGLAVGIPMVAASAAMTTSLTRGVFKSNKHISENATLNKKRLKKYRTF